MRQIQAKRFCQKAFGGHVGHQRQQKGKAKNGEKIRQTMTFTI